MNLLLRKWFFHTVGPHPRCCRTLRTNSRVSFWSASFLRLRFFLFFLLLNQNNEFLDTFSNFLNKPLHQVPRPRLPRPQARLFGLPRMFFPLAPSRNQQFPWRYFPWFRLVLCRQVRESLRFVWWLRDLMSTVVRAFSLSRLPQNQQISGFGVLFAGQFRFYRRKAKKLIS